jgi:hypothetical protein
MVGKCNYCNSQAIHGNENTCIEPTVVRDHIKNCWCSSDITQFVNAEHALASHSIVCERSKENNMPKHKDTKEEYFMRLMASLNKREPNKKWVYIFDDHGHTVGILSGDGKCEYGYMSGMQ